MAVLRLSTVWRASALAFAALLLGLTVALSAGDAAAGSKARPFKGKASGDIATAGPFAGTGTIIATHLGKSDVVFSGIAPTGTQGSTPNCVKSTGGTQTFTAANGDELHQTYDEGGEICFVGPGLLTGSFTLTVTGGTGRFDGAEGTITIEAEADLKTMTWSSVLAGEITY